jgi:hypothetical protein
VVEELLEVLEEPSVLFLLLVLLLFELLLW